MPKRPLHEVVRERRLVGDGAMGTELIRAGLEDGACGEAWNLEHPERVLAIQRRYVEAGADCLITNTFGANRITLMRRGYESELAEINRTGAWIARQAFDGRPGFVLGDIGPLGAILEPYGELSAVEAQTALEELGMAIDAALKARAPCIIASLAYDLLRDGVSYRTMMGVSPGHAAEFADGRGAHIVALNCGTGMDMAGAAKVARLYRRHCGLPIMVQPNAGSPVLENLKTFYREGPADMAKAVPEVLEAGVAIVGSCCGTTPEHTREIRRVVDLFNQRSPGG